MSSSFKNGSYYHVVNRGIEKKLVFVDKKDLDRFTSLLDYYRFKNQPARFSFRNRKEYKMHTELIPIVEIIAYSMMPNHFHILLKQLTDSGISTFISKLTNSYTKYFNARNKRSGPLFAGTFKAVEVNPDQLVDVSYFIHTEPVRQRIVFDLNRFPFSSFQEYMGIRKGFCEKDAILKNFTHSSAYKIFLLGNNNVESRIKSILLD